MSEKEAPRIEFPCVGYPIKVIGENGTGVQDLVIEVVQKHAPDLDTAEVTVQASRNGSFISVRLRITATGPGQLKGIHQDLMATGVVRMVI